METKECKKCGVEKPITDFNLTNSARGHVYSYCKVCGREVAREYYHSHPEHAERVRRRSRAVVAFEQLEPTKPRAKKTPEEKRAAHAAYMRDYTAKHPEVRQASNARAKQWHVDHPETYQKRREYILQWHKDHPVPGDRKRRNTIRHLYGLTADDYQRLFDNQGGRCALCGTTDGGKKTLSWKWGIGTLSIDHCHKTGRVRGLLCHLCNIRLGFHENLMDAIGETRIKDYLKHEPSRPPL